MSIMKVAMYFYIHSEGVYCISGIRPYLLPTFLGIEISTPSGNTTVKAAIICDLPARAQVLNMRQFNGGNGCHLCEDKGRTCEDNKLNRFWPYDGKSVLRTRSSLIKNAHDAMVKNDIVSLLC